MLQSRHMHDGIISGIIITIQIVQLPAYCQILLGHFERRLSEETVRLLMGCKQRFDFAAQIVVVAALVLQKGRTLTRLDFQCRVGRVARLVDTDRGS